MDIAILADWSQHTRCLCSDHLERDLGRADHGKCFAEVLDVERDLAAFASNLAFDGASVRADASGVRAQQYGAWLGAFAGGDAQLDDVLADACNQRGQLDRSIELTHIDDRASGAVNTGTYPNLNVKPGTATTQLSEEERAAAVASLKGAAAGQTVAGKGAGATANPAELRRLGAQYHVENSLA